MRKQKKNHYKPERHIRVRSDRHDPIDLRRLSRVLIDLALAQAEADAEAEAEHQQKQARAGHTTDPEKRAPSSDPPEAA